MLSRTSTDVPEFKNAVSLHSLGEEVSVTLYSGLLYTLEQVERELGPKQIVQAYKFLSGDERLDFSMIAARDVVLGEVQNAWYEVNGKDIPQSVMSNQERRLREAMMATKAKDEAATGSDKKVKEPRVTVKSIIEAGLRAGTANEKILADVKKQFPNGKADDTHIRYYRHFLVKAGELEKLPRATKPKAEKKAKEEAPAKASGSKPTKASASKPAKAKAGA
jgi:hypothetical protein